MFGKPGTYVIPNFEKVKQYILDKSKTLDEIFVTIFTDELSLFDKIKCLSVMQDQKVLTNEMLQKLQKTDNRVNEYILGLERDAEYDP